MSIENDLELPNVKKRKDELKMILEWRIKAQLNYIGEYRVTIAYNTGDAVKLENIKILGFCKGYEISDKILHFFDKFLSDVDSFGLLVESQNSVEVKNWEISFSNCK